MHFRKAILKSAFVCASLILTLSAHNAQAQIVSYDGLVGIDKNGKPALEGPGVTPTTWYFKSQPLVVVNVPCPNSSVQISETKTSTVKWTVSVGGTAGVDWGVVKAELETSYGVEVGKTHTIQISKTVPADKYVSKEVTVYTRYQTKQYTVLGKTLWVDIPIGWYQVHKDVSPTCPCETARNSEKTLRDYSRTLEPGQLKDSVVASADALSGVLEGFEALSASEILWRSTAGIEDALLALDVAAELGAAPEVVEAVGYELTTGTLDTIASGLLEEADSTHTFGRNDEVRFNPLVHSGLASLQAARQSADDATFGLGSFGAVGIQYSDAIMQLLAARSLVYSNLTAAEMCGEHTDEDVPGDSSSCFVDGVAAPSGLNAAVAAPAASQGLRVAVAP